MHGGHVPDGGSRRAAAVVATHDYLDDSTASRRRQPRMSPASLTTSSEPADELHIHSTPRYLAEASFAYRSVNEAFRVLWCVISR
jgi:hypothetical protein